MSGLTPEQMMVSYAAAYEAAHGRTVRITYLRGWYTIHSAIYNSKYRLADIGRMTSNLLAYSERNPR